MERVHKKEDKWLKDQYKKLIVSHTEKASKTLDEIWSLWEIDPSAKDLRDKFYVLEKYLNHIKRICEEWI